MGNTYWIQTKIGRKYSGESNDLSLIYRFDRELDKLCKKRKVTRLSEFADTTDIAYKFDGLDEDAPIHAETGEPYPLDEMEWFDAQAGIMTFEALQSAVSEGQPRRISDEERARILEDVQYCLICLRSLPKNTGQFHLAVIA